MNASFKHASLLLFSTAAVLTCTGSAHAANREVDAYLQRASAAAGQQVAAAGVAVPPGVRVKARIDSDGRLTVIQVLESSGSLETDLRTTRALRRLRVAQPPIVLVGAEVTVPVGPAALVTAKAP